MKNELSPNEKNIINKDNYSAYVAKLKATGGKFPINQFGNVNTSAIAEACDFKRGSFADPESALAKQLVKDIKLIGTQVKEESEEESALKKQKDEASKNASKLSKELERTNAEVHKLRDVVAKLEQENKALEHKLNGKSEAHEAMLDDGRRRFVWK